MAKEIRNMFCPECKKNVKAENFPQHIGPFGILLRIVLAFIFLFIPAIGIIFAILLLISIFTDTKKDEIFYCSHCGTVCLERKEK